ncbi:MAG: hypothetical protein JKY37_13320 [Nannocystaceae bacterium]|nr:hypothetical protein [Nannocystaceae bacterium]
MITNPNSGKNRKRYCEDPKRRLQELVKAAGPDAIVRQTRDLSHLREAVAEFYDAGCEYWVCDGGDGTLHWLLATAMDVARQREGLAPGDARVPSLPTVIPANGGSVDFIAHKAGVRGECGELVAALSAQLRRGQTPAHVELDTLRVVAKVANPAPGEPEIIDRVGFAAALGGVAQRFFEKLYAIRPVEPHKIAMLLGSAMGSLAVGRSPLVRVLPPRVRALPWLSREFADDIFEPTRARVTVDGQPLSFDSFASLQVGSIDINLAGVVRTFRHAATPGVLHAQAMSMSPLAVAANLPNIVLGTRIWGKRVYDGPAQSLRAVAIDALLDPVIDGEMFFGISEIEITRGPALAVPIVRPRSRSAAA